MGNYVKKAAAHARLVKLASVARLIRRQRAMEKYAQAVYMQKLAADGNTAKQPWTTGGKTGLAALIGAGVGGLGGLAFGPEDRKLLSTLIGAGAGAGVGAGGYQLAHHAFKDGGWWDAMTGKKAPATTASVPEMTPEQKKQELEKPSGGVEDPGPFQ